MQTTRDTILNWLITLLTGVIAALGIWLVAGQPEAAALGFVIAAAARDSFNRGCARRMLRSAR